jgi:hypothetical protein
MAKTFSVPYMRTGPSLRRPTVLEYIGHNRTQTSYVRSGSVRIETHAILHARAHRHRSDSTGSAAAGFASMTIVFERRLLAYDVFEEPLEAYRKSLVNEACPLLAPVLGVNYSRT